MATLVFSAIGTALGGPLGGAIGALAGRALDQAVIGSGHREGPRLKELAATTSSYGTPVPRLFGRMRVPGTIIWATDLLEHREKQAGGKASPSVTSYSYTASFAVALSSRAIAGIGRIWADGNLLRGAAGDLKAAGTLRIYSGEADQDPDPLMAAAEGVDRCPGYRGLAYVVFEDLALADFFNRIPALTFEIFADPDGFSLAEIVEAVIEDAEAELPLPGLEGFLCEGSLADTLRVLDPIYPMDCDAGGESLTFARERLQAGPIAMAEPAVSVRDEDFGSGAGYSRKRSPVPQSAPEILRYYDVGRDYLTGLQRALGRAGPGQPDTVDVPAAMTATSARDLVERMARRGEWSRDQLAWRTAELDPAIAPGTIISVPSLQGRWRVDEWEWRDTGVELSLSRIIPTGPDAAMAVNVDAGRASLPADIAATPTLLAAFELPWDGSGMGDQPSLFAAVSSAGSNWKGAAMFVDNGDGNLLPLGSSGRIRSILGETEAALAAADPLLVDRSSTLFVRLPDPMMNLPNADGRQLALGANRALVGNEIIQFASAVPLGGGRWRLECFMRGRGGTESTVGDHVAGEPFVLIDSALVPLDEMSVRNAKTVSIVASGLADVLPVTTPVALRGITRRPLSPVHPRVDRLANGSLDLGWTRRARGAWVWDDGVDVPLHEELEVYSVTFGDPAGPAASWIVTEPRLAIDEATITMLASLLPGGELSVRQQGSYAFSDALFLAVLP